MSYFGFGSTDNNVVFFPVAGMVSFRPGVQSANDEIHRFRLVLHKGKLDEKRRMLLRRVG